MIHENDLNWLDKAINESKGREQSHRNDHDSDVPLSQFITNKKNKHKEQVFMSKDKSTGKKKSVSPSFTNNSSSGEDNSSNDDDDDDGGANTRDSQ